MGDSLCCLRFILPRIPQIFTDFICPSIRAPLCYLWETHSHPISVFICAICGRFLRTLTYVGDSLCSLRFDSPTDSTDFHRFYISQNPCSSALSVENFPAPNIRVNLRYLWELPSATWDLFSHGFSQILYILCAVCEGFIYMIYMWEPDEINSHWLF